jgi:hypothetical protein
MENEPEVVECDRFSKGLVVTFGSGEVFFFAAATLWKLRDQADEQVTPQEEDESGPMV